MGNRLRHLHMHDAYCLLRHALALPKVLYTWELHPAFSPPSLQSFDLLLRALLGDIANMNIIENDLAWSQASPLVWSGGLRVRSRTQLAPSSFLASAASCTDIIHLLLPPRIRDTSSQARESLESLESGTWRTTSTGYWLLSAKLDCTWMRLYAIRKSRPPGNSRSPLPEEPWPSSPSHGDQWPDQEVSGNSQDCGPPGTSRDLSGRREKAGWGNSDAASHLLTVHMSTSMPSSFSFHALCFFRATSTTASCFILCLMSSFLTLSSFVTPPTLLKYLISAACSLLTCCFCIVQVSHPYNSVETTIALNTQLCSLAQLSSLRDIWSHCSNHLRCSSNSILYLFVHISFHWSPSCHFLSPSSHWGQGCPDYSTPSPELPHSPYF